MEQQSECLTKLSSLGSHCNLHGDAGQNIQRVIFTRTPAIVITITAYARGGQKWCEQKATLTGRRPCPISCYWPTESGAHSLDGVWETEHAWGGGRGGQWEQRHIHANRHRSDIQNHHLQIQNNHSNTINEWMGRLAALVKLPLHHEAQESVGREQQKRTTLLMGGGAKLYMTTAQHY